MPRPTTALVLTPSLGGDFFGDVISGLAHHVVSCDGRLLIVETRQEHLPRDEIGSPGDFSARVGWARADGAICLTTAAAPEYLEALRASGPPVVLLSGTQMGGFAAPVARPDNRQGVLGAVTHLIGHGHTRIGFVGNMAQCDIQERYDAYRECLEEAGLSADPATLFDVAANGETHGAAAARAFLSMEDRPTAILCATDRNAQGFLEVVAEAGVDVPRDVAIVGFDNTSAGTFTSPSLTTIDPRFDRVGALSARLLWQLLRGEDVPHRTVTPTSATLIVRESCGCVAADRPVDDGTVPAPPAVVREHMRDVLERELLTGDAAADAAAHEVIEAAVNEGLRLLHSGDEASAAELNAFTASLQRLSSRPDTLRRFLDAMTAPTHESGLTTVSAARASVVPTGLTMALWKAQASAFLRRTEATAVAIEEQYAIDAGLLATEGADPRDLNWLHGTRVRAGLLGLWTDGAAAGELTIVGEYEVDGTPLGLLDTTMRVEDFPPEALMVRADPGQRQACVVMPVRNSEQDWGVMAVVVELDHTAVQDTHLHWASLLCAALESQRRQEEVRRSALFDALTGLPNRQLFLQQVDLAIARRHRTGEPFSVLFLDLDGFKQINDALGHQVGDEVLVRAAADIVRPLRRSDTAARFGGDEFVVLLAGTEPGEAMVVAKRVRAALERARTIEGHEITTKASIGIASSAVHYTTADEVLRDADAAMYRAKSSEPGTIAYFDVPMHLSAVRREEIAREVRVGLSRSEFDVLYEPIVTLATGRVHGFSALVRWRHPTHGDLMSRDFLADIEEAGIVAELGDWVLGEALGQLAAWDGLDVTMHMGVPGKEFWSPRFASRARAALESHAVDPARLTLGVSESVLMHHPRVALRITSTLHEAGVRFVIDDFGQGHSSFETPHRFPAESLMIDTEYVRSLTPGRDGDDLIASMVAFGSAVGTAIEVSGVKTPDDVPVLKALGCLTARGPGLCRALPPDEAITLLGKPLDAARPR